MQLSGKVVLVTGASSGIGRAIAIACAKLGCVVLVHYRNNRAGALETLQEVTRFSNGAVYAADLSSHAEVKDLFQAIQKDRFVVDILVNNAGEAMPGQFDDVAVWESQWRNTFMSVVFTCTEFLSSVESKALRKIINIGSLYGFESMGNPDLPQYSAMKAAVSNYTCTLAKKLSPAVLVNAIAPGYTWTPSWHEVPQARLSALQEKTHIKRFITAEEIAQSVVLVLQNDAITGEIVRIDGGLHLLPL